MKKLIALLFVLSILFIACETDEPDETLETPVYAGIQHDQMMLCDTLNHEMEFNLDSTENWYYAYDSLDINFDNDFDLHFKLVFPAADTFNENVSSNYYPMLKLKLENDFQTAMYQESFYVGLGQTSYINWVDTLSYEKRIDDLPMWTDSISSIYLWVEPISANYYASNGPWYNLENTVKYIGLRYYDVSEWKYAWVKIDVTTRNDIRLVSFAIES